MLLLGGCSSRRRTGRLLLTRCLRLFLFVVLDCFVRGLLRRVFALARGLAGVLVSAFPVLLLAGLGAIDHDLAAGAVAEGLVPLGTRPAVDAGCHYGILYMCE